MEYKGFIMICLTGDLHHKSLKTLNQKHCDITEMQTARAFLKCLEKHKVKMTCFITGKSFLQEFDDVSQIIHNPLIKIGGHNYDAFENEFLHRVWNKLTKNYNGPKWVQKRDVLKTMDIIYKMSGKEIKVWRNHMYMHGINTEEVLYKAGIKICSDGVLKNSYGLQKHTSGLYNLPINIIPDHEHLIHAERTPKWIEAWRKRYKWSDDFGSKSYYINEWCKMVLKQLKENEKKGLLSNLIIHPITMYLCDKFEKVEDILAYISSCENIHMSKLLSEKGGNHV